MSNYDHWMHLYNHHVNCSQWKPRQSAAGRQCRYCTMRSKQSTAVSRHRSFLTICAILSSAVWSVISQPRRSVPKPHFTSPLPNLSNIPQNAPPHTLYSLLLQPRNPSHTPPTILSFNARQWYPSWKKALTAPLVLLDPEVLGVHTSVLIYVLAAKVAAEGAELLGREFLDKPFREDGSVYSAWSHSTWCALSSRSDSWLWAAERHHQ